MKETRQIAKGLVMLLLVVTCAQGVFVEPLEPITSQHSLAEGETRLPCHYQVEEEEKVVQVTWFKEHADGTKEQIITAHFMDGHTEFGHYAGRVRFERSIPMENSALLISSTEVSDEGRYTCHISTFPNGNFERRVTLSVWILPIAALEPEVLVEGQTFRVAASCRAVGRPRPRLTWNTDLPGQYTDRIKEDGSVSSFYSLHPLRSMNGKKLDCMVWHAGLEQPRRITNYLIVHYPPDAAISSATAEWFVGLKKGELVCSSGGYPKPENVTWKWNGGALPDGTSVVGEKLIFGRPLRLNDSGLYECVVKNKLGFGKTEYMMTISENSQLTDDSPISKQFLTIIGASAGALVIFLVTVVFLVNCYHRKKNRKLVRQLSGKMEEINNLSRETSLRRLNSFSTDPRVQPDDYALLRVDSCLKNSQLSLDSGLLSSMGPIKVQQDDSDSEQSNPKEEDSPQSIVEGYEGDEDSSFYQLSEALTNHFYYSNGVLRPKLHPNAILLHSRAQII
ncbi:nectin-4 [Takifugu flavidus]|uniref:nectin-4 n=1 Tax=Takifugu flavidus TaxID=433684 RepID=UPI002543FC56|nr:nectin-4 [Takifugu flavidus]